MYCLRSLRVVKPFSKVALSPSLNIRRNLSIFPRSIINHEPNSFPPVIRLLDEFDKYSRSIDQPLRSQLISFNPKFDIKETSNAYELQGELPGIDQKDIEIEFSDASTLTISGQTERITESSDSISTSVSTTDANDKTNSIESPDSNSNSKYSSATEQDSSRQAGENSNGVSPEKFWLMERNFGEFSRSFKFPSQVDESNVSARMINGILKITVPKLRKQPGRKIIIQ